MRDPNDIIAKATLAYARREIDRETYVAVVRLAKEIDRLNRERLRSPFWRRVRRWIARLFS